MSIFLTILLAVQMFSALAMIGLILFQHGKGADMGAAFGSGGSGSLFGASGSANFMSRATSILAAVFFVATLMLSYFGSVRSASTNSVLEGAAVSTPAPVTAPVPVGPAGQIPGNTPAAPAATGSAPSSASAAQTPAPTSVPVVPAATKSTGQIPTK
jgi:preprotein translocase subunit SecG